MAEAATSRREARREERRAAILACAQAMFHDHGYGGMKMSALAGALGGSKSTLWAYYRDKEELFTAVIDDLATKFATAIRIDPAEDPATLLPRYATEFLTVMLSPEILALNRLIIAEAPRFPKLGRIFFERGPGRRQRVLADYLAGHIARGRLRDIDPLIASAQFHHLCQAGLFIRTMWGLAPAIDAAAVRADAERSARLFLEGCAAPAATA